MPNLIDCVGLSWGRLTVLSQAGVSTHGSALWLCQCECGKTTIVRARRANSCGCLRREGKTTHGKRHTKEYTSWAGMIQRCTNKNVPKYARYGGRGIFVCDRWRVFENFIADMGVSGEKESIERIDNNGNYEPANCRWATNQEQSRNKTTNLVIEYNGKKQCLEAWAFELGFKSRTLQQRLASGWTVERAFKEKVRSWN